MKILFCHNFYQLPGGEDQVYQDECWLLDKYGHEVLRYEQSNEALRDLSQWTMAAKTLWNRQSYREIEQIVRVERPDVVHFHNTFPLISPSAYYAAAREGAAVVQTLHNYRMICPSATLLRDQKFCNRCVGRTLAIPSIRHKCYRDSRSATAATAGLNAWQRIAGTRNKAINRFIALTRYSRDHFINSGMDPNKIAVKPNFVRPDPGISTEERKGAVFIGRLSVEKGIDTLLDAWRYVEHSIPLSIIGDGPLSDRVRDAATNNPSIHWLGQLPFDRVLQQVGRARVLVFPSCWAETFGRSMIEAFATGTPVIASDMASMKEIVTHGVNGMHFRTGDAHDLADKVAQCDRDDDWYQSASRAARAEFENHYSAEANFESLMGIYQQAIADRHDSRRETNKEVAR